MSAEPAPSVLYVVPTPIGNLEDLSARAARVLTGVDLIAAEDTRSAERLLRHLGAWPREVVSCFDGNEASRAEGLVERLRAGASVALVSEAGTPSVSDPGERLIGAVRAAGLAVVALPGPSAPLVALVGSGLPAAGFTFLGFPPREEGARQALFARFLAAPETLLLFEAPGRVGATLADLAAVFGAGRRGCVARELTKLHEELIVETLGELAARFAEDAPRGECTLVVAGASPEEQRAARPLDLEAEVDALLGQGISPKEIATRLALKGGGPRRQIYQLALLRAGRR